MPKVAPKAAYEETLFWRVPGTGSKVLRRDRHVRVGWKATHGHFWDRPDPARPGRRTEVRWTSFRPPPIVIKSVRGLDAVILGRVLPNAA